MSKITKDRTLIFLDWDDTLFPTNWLANKNVTIQNLSGQFTLHFRELDNALFKFLKSLLNYGTIIIVTNALRDWVYQSSTLLPISSAVLKKLQIVSARERYGEKVNSIMGWKILTFEDLVDKEYAHIPFNNIISIGDAEYEYRALVALNNKYIHRYLKNVKLIKAPDFDSLVDQLEVLTRAIPEIYGTSRHLDLNFSLYSKVKDDNEEVEL